MMRRLTLLAAGALMGAVATGGVVQLAGSGGATAASVETYRQLNLFGDIFERVRADYVEEPEEAVLIEAAVNGMLSSLDPHSSYLNARAFQDMQVQTRGEFYGLGIEVTMENGIIRVISPIDETPAAKAGVLAGDLITHLDGEPVQGLTLREAVDRMRGPANSSIVLTVIREGIEEPLSITVVRDVIRVQSVRHRVDDDIGYIRIASFSEQTTQGLQRAVRLIREQVPPEQLKGIVLDLRGNPGGLLDQAVQVTDAFLNRGEIVSTRGRHPQEVQRFNARTGDVLDDIPLIVLQNGGSASASEIVAGALQDHRRATIIGTPSFGKGSVQTIIPIGRTGAIRLTTARYYTPSGRSIQARGITPDIVVLPDVPEELLGSRYTAVNEADLRGHLLGEGESAPGAEDSAETEQVAPDPDAEQMPLGLYAAYVPEDPALDRQLNYAYDLLRGIQVDASFPPSVMQGIPN